MKIIQIVVVPLKGSIIDDQERIFGLGDNGNVYVWYRGDGKWVKHSIS